VRRGASSSAAFARVARIARRGARGDAAREETRRPDARDAIVARAPARGE